MFSPDETHGNIPDNELLELYQESLDLPTAGSIIKGVVERIEPEKIYINVGFKIEGTCMTEEFKDSEGNLNITIGQEVEIFVEKANYKTGIIRLSRKKALEILIWNKLEKAYKNKEEVKGKVVKKVRGGLEVDLGVPAFLPSSQVDIKIKRNLEKFIGREFLLRIIKFNRKKENIIVSRKVILEEEQEKKKNEILSTIEEGSIVYGVVKSLTEYGAFIDLGGIDGLLHIQDMSWGRINHPKEILRVGQRIKAKVIKFEKEKEKIALGLKQMREDPWNYVYEKYPPGKKVKGKVVSIVSFGAFVELEEGVEGLLHITEMSWKKIKNPKEVLEVNDIVEVAVMEVNLDQKRISLSLKQVVENPWNTIALKYKVGEKIRGKVRNITDFGAFVEVEEGVEGLIHLSDITRKPINHPSEVLKTDMEVETVIIALDSQRQKLSLSMKDLEPDEWNNFVEKHELYEVLEGVVKRIADFGIFVMVAEGVEGLVHISEIPKAPSQRIQRMFKVGDTVKVRIIRIDKDTKKLGLSMKDLEN